MFVSLPLICSGRLLYMLTFLSLKLPSFHGTLSVYVMYHFGFDVVHIYTSYTTHRCVTVAMYIRTCGGCLSCTAHRSQSYLLLVVIHNGS